MPSYAESHDRSHIHRHGFAAAAASDAFLSVAPSWAGSGCPSACPSVATTGTSAGGASEEGKFLRELRFGDKFSIDLRLAAASPDGRKWRMCHRIVRGGDGGIDRALQLEGVAPVVVAHPRAVVDRPHAEEPDGEDDQGDQHRAAEIHQDQHAILALNGTHVRLDPLPQVRRCANGAGKKAVEPKRAP